MEQYDSDATITDLIIDENLNQDGSETELASDIDTSKPNTDTDKSPDNNDTESIITRSKPKISCYYCKEQYTLKHVKLSPDLTPRLKKYACHICFDEQGKVSTWEEENETRHKYKGMEVYGIKGIRIDEDDNRTFKIYWAGFPKDRATWEPEINLRNAYLLLENFLAKRNLKPNIRRIVGSTSELDTNQSKWPTSEEVKKVIEKIQKHPAYIQNISIEIARYNTNTDGIKLPLNVLMLLEVQSHLYVLRRLPSQTVVVSDGDNNCQQPGIAGYLKFLITNIQTLQLSTFEDQIKTGQCGSSAALIGLEMIKRSNEHSIPLKIMTVTKLRSEVRNRLHFVRKPTEDKAEELKCSQAQAAELARKGWRLISCTVCEKKFRGTYFRKNYIKHRELAGH